MKAQTAFIEAILAGLVLVSSLAMMYKQVYQTSSSAGIETINMANAVQDLQSISYSHTQWGICIAYVEKGCITSILRNFSYAYMLTYASINIGNQAIEYGNASMCKSDEYYCFPAPSSNASKIACVYVCGD